MGTFQITPHNTVSFTSYSQIVTTRNFAVIYRHLAAGVVLDQFREMVTAGGFSGTSLLRPRVICYY